MKKSKEIAVVVTTAYKGVFFGYVDGGHQMDAPTIRLERARLCLYWSSDLKGFMGLASHGPNKSCRVGPAVPITLRDVASVTECTEEATKNWEAAPWNP